MFSYAIAFADVEERMLMKEVFKSASSMGYKSDVVGMGFGLALSTETEMTPEHIENIKKIKGVTEIAPAAFYHIG